MAGAVCIFADACALRANFDIKRKAKVTTMWALPIWVVIAGTILSGAITVRDLDWFDRMSTPEVSRD